MRGREFKTQRDIDRYVAQGYGQGEGSAYKPWLRLQDVSSQGRSRKVQGLKTGRIHHLLSDLEYGYLLVLEYSERVVDIREQFPLFPVTALEDIARSMGIKYPRYPGTRLPYVMSTDFLITVRDEVGKTRIVARTTKYDSALDRGEKLLGTLEKFEIEKTFWGYADVDWAIVTDEIVTKTLALNLNWLRQGAEIDRRLLRQDLLRNYLDQLDHIGHHDRSLSGILRLISHRLNLPYADSVLMFKHLTWNKAVVSDLNTRILLSGPAPMFRVVGLRERDSTPKAA